MVMKRLRGLFPLALALVVALVGCEDGGNDRAADYFSENNIDQSALPTDYEKPSIDPASASLAKIGDQVTLTGVGGMGPYRWEVRDSSRGRLTVRAWSQALYTRTGDGDNTVIMYDRTGHLALANIAQPDTPLLNVSPAAANLAADGDNVVFTASGGVAPYTWTLTGPGTLSSTSGTNTRYTRNAAGNAQLECRDNSGQTVIVLISNP
jgi:hypothetical protein